MSAFKGIETAQERLTPTVEDLVGRTPHWTGRSSASQVDTVKACVTQWALRKLYGFQEPERAATQLGKRVHAELEDYLEHGTPVGPIAAAGLHHLPTPPIHPALIERRFAYQDPEAGVWVVGLIDLVLPDLGLRRILDHKTTSDFRYCKTEHELRYNTQALIYGALMAPLLNLWDTRTGRSLRVERHGAEAQDFPVYDLRLDLVERVESVSFTHVYYRTRRNPDSRTTEVSWSGSELADLYRSKVAPFLALQRSIGLLHISGEELVRDPSLIPHNTDACGRFGGCHFRDLCGALGHASRPFNHLRR